MRAVSRGWSWVGLLGLLGLVGTLACSQPMPKNAVQVRIRNEMGVELKELTLGPGEREGDLERYGRIAAGETTGYRARQPLLSHYRTLRYVTADGVSSSLTVYPEQHLGMRELPAGRYTFALTRKGAQPALRIVAEPRY